MSKTTVYSWRVDSHLKAALEQAARRENRSVSSLLTRIAEEWLGGKESMAMRADSNRLKEMAARYLGSVRGGDPNRAQEASQRIKKTLRAKHAGRRVD